MRKDNFGIDYYLTLVAPPLLKIQTRYGPRFFMVTMRTRKVIRKNDIMNVKKYNIQIGSFHIPTPLLKIKTCHKSQLSMWQCKYDGNR